MSTGRKARPAAGAPAANGQLDSLEFVRASLAGVQTNIFLADPRLTIVYANERALETLRGIERKREMPLEYVENQTYLHYNKGSLVMYALRDYIGEDRVNRNLSSTAPRGSWELRSWLIDAAVGTPVGTHRRDAESAEGERIGSYGISQRLSFILPLGDNT